jgi:hypothetical protein
MDDDLRERLRAIEARIAGKGDQALHEFRDVYDSFDDSQKQQFRDALAKVAEGHEMLRGLPLGYVRATIQTHWESRDNEGELVAGGIGEFSPRVLVEAIAAWEKGEGYSSSGMRFTG